MFKSPTQNLFIFCFLTPLALNVSLLCLYAKPAVQVEINIPAIVEWIAKKYNNILLSFAIPPLKMLCGMMQSFEKI